MLPGLDFCAVGLGISQMAIRNPQRLPQGCQPSIHVVPATNLVISLNEYCSVGFRGFPVGIRKGVVRIGEGRQLWGD